MSESSNWREVAFEVYRLTWANIDTLKSLQRDDLDYWIEELREALLDLKQATIEEDEARASHHIEEIAILIAELRLHL